MTTTDRGAGNAASLACASAAALCVLMAAPAQAATFASVDFDSGKNELIAKMTYDGTNPDHRFSVKWDKCRKLGDQGNHQIVAQLLDDQWDDSAQQTFTTTVHVSLAGLDCHPVLVTLRTAPNYEYSVQIP
jgi:hypothetical protein